MSVLLDRNVREGVAMVGGEPGDTVTDIVHILGPLGCGVVRGQNP